MDAKLAKAFRKLGNTVNTKEGSVDFGVYEDSQETYALYFDSSNTIRWERYLDWNQKQPQATGEFNVRNQDVISISRAFLNDVLKVSVDANIKNLISKVRDSKNPLLDKKGNHTYNIDSDGKGYVAHQFPGQLRELWIDHSGSPIDYFTVQPLLIEAFFNEGMLFKVNRDYKTGRNPYNSFEWNPSFPYKSLKDAIMDKVGNIFPDGGDYTQRTNEGFVVHTSFSQFIKNI